MRNIAPPEGSPPRGAKSAQTTVSSEAWGEKQPAAPQDTTNQPGTPNLPQAPQEGGAPKTGAEQANKELANDSRADQQEVTPKEVAADADTAAPTEGSPSMEITPEKEPADMEKNPQVEIFEASNAPAELMTQEREEGLTIKTGVAQLQTPEAPLSPAAPSTSSMEQMEGDDFDIDTELIENTLASLKSLVESPPKLDNREANSINTPPEANSPCEGAKDKSPASKAATNPSSGKETRKDDATTQKEAEEWPALAASSGSPNAQTGGPKEKASTFAAITSPKQTKDNSNKEDPAKAWGPQEQLTPQEYKDLF